MDVFSGFRTACRRSEGSVKSAVFDEDGNALYSWRVRVRLILCPDDLVGVFNSRLAWHHEENQAIRNEPTSLMFGDGTSVIANIVAVTGIGTAFNSDAKLHDLPVDTILLIEWRDSDVEWYKPRDISIEYLQLHADSTADTVLGYGDFFVAFADGSVWLLSGTTPISEILPLCSTKPRGTVDRRNRLARWRIHTM